MQVLIKFCMDKAEGNRSQRRLPTNLKNRNHVLDFFSTTINDYHVLKTYRFKSFLYNCKDETKSPQPHIEK